MESSLRLFGPQDRTDSVSKFHTQTLLGKGIIAPAENNGQLERLQKQTGSLPFQANSPFFI